jgi:hypothetical protein
VASSGAVEPVSSDGVTVLLLIKSVPGLGFALQTAGLGGIAGTVAGYHARNLNPHVDTWAINARWITLGFIVGVFVVIGDAITTP